MRVFDRNRCIDWAYDFVAELFLMIFLSTVIFSWKWKNCCQVGASPVSGCCFWHFFFCPLEALTWIQTEPLKQKRKKRKRGATGTVASNSTAQVLLEALRTEAVRKGRAANDVTLTLGTLKMIIILYLKSITAQSLLMAAVTITPLPQTVQLTTTLTDFQVLKLFYIERHFPKSQKSLSKSCCTYGIF